MIPNYLEKSGNACEMYSYGEKIQDIPLGKKCQKFCTKTEVLAKFPIFPEIFEELWPQF